MRCKACPAVMTVEEMARKQPDGSNEELCTRCLVAAGIIENDEEAMWDRLIDDAEDSPDHCS